MPDFIEEAVQEFEHTFRYIGNKGVECDHISIKNMADFMASKLTEQRERLVLGEDELHYLIMKHWEGKWAVEKKCLNLTKSIIAHQKRKEEGNALS